MYTKKDKNSNVVEDKKKRGAHQTAIDKAKNLTSKAKKNVGEEGYYYKIYIRK